jgi:RNA polymerase sigma factor (sigma-70 family)
MLVDGVAMQGDDDRALLRACRDGDENAWETLVRRYQRLIYAIPRRAGLGEDQSAEVFQRVFLTLVEHLDRIEQPERLAAWLATTARRESWRVSRQGRATVPLTSDSGEADDAAAPIDTAPLPDEEIERMERQHEVRHAVGRLDERCRALLTMLFYRAAPPPYLEVAIALGVPEGSIGPTRARCLQKLRRILEEAG